MKRLSIAFISGTLLLSLGACGGSDSKSEMADTIIDMGPTVRDSLNLALAEQDSLLAIITEINDGMTQIKDMERILSNPTNLDAESPSQRQKLRDDMAAIQQALQSRRERLAAFEQKLATSNKNNSKLQATIESLKKQIDDQEATIKDLRTQLDNANVKIESLGRDVDSLTTTVKNVTDERDAAQQKSSELTNELNTCYFAIGSKTELKNKKIIETGFLRKTKIMPSDFEQGYFTRADKTKLTTINLHTKKAQILTNQPADSYTLDDVNGQKVLRITNPNRFWSLSNYLVIQVD